MNYYPFHIGDFAAHTAHLTWEEDIAYRRMLDWYYLNEKALPADPAKVARLVRMPKSIAVIEAVLAEFFLMSEDGWHNKRADEELAGMLAKQEQQGVKDEHEAERMRRFRDRRAQMFAGLRKVGVIPAWDVPMKELQRLFDQACNAPETHLQREQAVTENANATAIPTPTPTPTPVVKEYPLPPGGGIPKGDRRVHEFPPGFDRFWLAYPRKTAKPQAAKAFARLRVDEPLLARMLEALALQSRSDQWQRDQGQFIPHPSTWLNARRWEDEAAPLPSQDRWAGCL